jgi:hypothetical protein
MANWQGSESREKERQPLQRHSYILGYAELVGHACVATQRQGHRWCIKKTHALAAYMRHTIYMYIYTHPPASLA